MYHSSINSNSDLWRFLQKFSDFSVKHKKVNRKVQGVPQSQAAANPRQQEEEKEDKNHIAQLSLPQVR